MLLKKGFLYPALLHYQKALSVYPSVPGIYMNLADYY